MRGDVRSPSPIGDTMSKNLQWLLGLAALVLVLAFAASMILPFFFPTASGFGMMGPGMAGRGMMGGMGGFGLGMFSWPLLLIGLVVAAAFWFSRTQRSASSPATPAPIVARICPTCGQALQPEWKACPHCGEHL